MPLLKLTYLLALAAGLFFLRDWRVLAGIAGMQLVLWAVSRVSPAYLLRIARRMSIFLAVVFVVHGLTKTRGGGESDWVPLVLGIEVNLAGLQVAVAMGLRVIALVLASTWVQRSGDPRDFARALIIARVPRGLAWSIDASLTLLTSGGGGGGGMGGGGMGGGGGKGKRDKKPFTFAELRRGDLGFLRDLIHRGIARAADKVRSDHPELAPERARDVAVVSGIALAAMGLKMIQVMPGLPIAPGLKNIILLPCFLLAAAQTRSRFGGTWCATTVGLLSFFLGFGKWGILELGHFVAPGLLIDLLLPLVTGTGRWRVVQLCAMGSLLGAARFGAQFLVILLAGDVTGSAGGGGGHGGGGGGGTGGGGGGTGGGGGAGLEADPLLALLLFYSPMLLSQMVFGTLSGLVSAYLLGPGGRLPAEPSPVPEVEPGPGSGSGRGGGHGGGGGGGGGGGRRRQQETPDPAPPGGNQADVSQAT